MAETQEVRDKVVLVGLNSPVLKKEENADEDTMEELSALVETAGGETVGIVLQNRPSPDPRTFIGEGKVAEVQLYCENTGATMVIFDNDLSPSQMRVLTELLGVQVLDRCGLILDIFAQRAKTKEGPAPGGAGPVPVSAAPADRHVDPSGATGGHQRQGAHRLQGPRRDPAGDGPPPHPPEDRQAPGGPGGGPPGALHPAPAAAEERDPGGGHRGLHQRGQVHAPEPPDRGGHPRQQPAVRHPGHHQPPSHGQRHAGRGDLRHGGLHPQAAPPAGGGFQGHAGGAGVRGSAAPRHRRVQPGVAAAGGRWWRT